MAKIANLEDGAIIEGYDSVTGAEWCSPTFLGCSVCVAASATNGQVSLTIGLKTPFGNVSKTFSFNANISYTWQPLSRFKITVSITNFNEANGVFSFDMGINPCVDIPVMGWKCFNYSHKFVIPVSFEGITSDIDDSRFASILALHAGNAFGSAEGSMFQGDIYSNYLKGQGSSAGVPTLPVDQCVPTVQCIPTLSCIPTVSCTGIPFICATHGMGAANVQAGIPTLPVNQCVPTVQCVPTLSCIPTASCTGIPFICATHGMRAANVQGGFPTIPVADCIPTRSCVPTITSCITGYPPLCATPPANLQGGFPTIPVADCIPTRSCVPTITSCVTGYPPLCATPPAGGANAAALPTLPVNQCVATMQCVPTLSCIPTTGCTGIPFIC